MAETQKHIRVQSPGIEGIDFNKLKIVVRSNWILLLLIFFVANSVAFLVVRYTKSLYQSTSVVKLDVKKEASEFGIKTPLDDQNLNLISGEIEIIQSRLFLDRVVDSSALTVSYFSIGRFLNDELYQSHPFTITYAATNQNLFNTPISFEEISSSDFLLQIGKGDKIKGKYDTQISLGGLKISFHRNENFVKGDEIGYFFIINSKESLLYYLLMNLTAEPLNFNANTIQISFKDHNPFKARAILNKIDTMYLQYSNEQKNLATKQKIKWVSDELVNIEKKMEDYEHYFENFTLQNKTNNLDEDLQQTVAAINQVDSQRFELTQKISQLNTLMEGLKNKNFFISLIQREVLPPSLVKSLESLEELYLAQEKMKLSYSEITFAYREKQRALETTREKAFSQLVEIRAESMTKLQHVNRAKERLENEFANLPDKATQFTKNQRYYKLYEQFYLTLMQSKSEFEITQAGSIPDFKILSPATLPGAPISPNKLLITGIGLVMGFVLMLLVLGTLYLLNNKITSISEIERIDQIPVLGIVPSSRYLNGGGLHVIEHPKSMVSEAIRTLRTNLDFFSVHSNKKVIAISSTVSGEGKSFIAMNLGGVLALSGKRVVLLDLDMRKPKPIPLGKDEVDRTKGVSTILIRKNSWQESVIKTSLANFDYIPSGPHPPNPSELLMNGEFEGLLADLKQAYDYIILDTPPVGLVTDGIMAMKRSDISIYIFRANYSKKDFLLNLQRIININKFSNITTLLNALPNTGEKSYGYGYYEEAGNSNWVKKIFKA